MANTLNLGTDGNWATKEDSLLAYNSENNNYKPLPFDFTRASSATVVNKAGLIETVGSGEPRIDFSNDAKGALLLEPTRSNQMINSEDLTGWTIQAGATVTLESINNPVNSTNANLITVNTNGVYANRNTPDVSALYSVSFWLHKNNQSGTIELTNAQGGSFGKWTINLDLLQNDFVRITRDHSSVTVVVEFTTLATGEVAPFFKSPTGTKSFYVTGFQLEQSYATSYIPTSGSAVTRVADSSSQTVPDGVIGQTEGTVFLDFKPQTLDGTSRYLSIENSNSVGSGWMGVFASLVSGTIRFRFYGNGWDIDSSLIIEKDTRYKIAFSYKNGVQTSIYVNGNLLNNITASLSGKSYQKIRLSEAAIGNRGDADFNDIKLYDTIKTDQELIALTS